MDSNSMLQRQSDGQMFKPVYIAHWSDIVSIDGKQFDTVKFAWDFPLYSMYIGFSGQKYLIAKNNNN